MSDTLKLEMEDPVLKGILDGSRAFIGPGIVQFDITNRCNNNCLCCWNNSPLLGKPTEGEKKERGLELPFDLIERTVSELKQMETKTIFLAGGGEPFMHSDIMKILRCMKASGMKVVINTNFMLVDKKRAKEIIELKIDLVHISLLAGTAKTYALVHPNKTEKAFRRIKDTLKYLLYLRAKKNQTGPVPLPHIDLYYVIFNKNYQDISDMTGLAMDLKVNTLEFTPIDVIPGKTDILLLNDWQRNKVLEEVKTQHQRLEEFNRQQGGKVTFIEQYDSFINRLSAKESTEGKYESHTFVGRPCYVGWSFLRILANGNVTPCLKAHRISVGNIYQQSLKDIWNSPAQQLFRREVFELNRNNHYFKMIGNDPDTRFGCLKACDNIQINIDMHKKYADILKGHGKIRKT